MEETVLCYIENMNNEYLMLHRTKKKNDLNEGKWLGIGGHIENDEKPIDAIKREVFEETGLRINEFNFRGKLLFVNDSYSELIYLFTANTKECDIICCSEGDLFWVSKNKIFDLNLWDGDRCFLKRLIDTNDYFEMKLVYENDKFIRSENI